MTKILDGIDCGPKGRCAANIDNCYPVEQCSRMAVQEVDGKRFCKQHALMRLGRRYNDLKRRWIEEQEDEEWNQRNLLRRWLADLVDNPCLRRDLVQHFSRLDMGTLVAVRVVVEENVRRGLLVLGAITGLKK